MEKFNNHSNDIGDWCPYSGEPVPEDYNDDRCPQWCRASAIVDADDPNA
jgi:hypothetical protein